MLSTNGPLPSARFGRLRPSRSGEPSDRLVEWLFAGMMISWGMWLLSPAWVTFDNPQYAALNRLAGETSWGAFSVAIGAIRISALVVNGRYARTPIARLLCSSLGVIWWLVLMYLFLITPQSNPPAGFAWYPVFVVFEAISCWRSAADAYHSNAFRPIRTPRIFAGPRGA